MILNLLNFSIYNMSQISCNLYSQLPLDTMTKFVILTIWLAQKPLFRGDRYPFELHRLIDEIQMSTLNIRLL